MMAFMERMEADQARLTEERDRLRDELEKARADADQAKAEQARMAQRSPPCSRNCASWLTGMPNDMQTGDALRRRSPPDPISALIGRSSVHGWRWTSPG